MGIEDDGCFTGVCTEKENEFRQAAFDYLQLPPDYQVEMVPCILDNGESGRLMLFHVAPSANEIITTKNGEAYLRVGDATRKLNAETLAALEYSKGIKSYESRLIDDATLDDLDADLIRQYTERLNVSASSALDVLKGRGLIREKDGQLKITVAAVLLFGKCPTQYLPGARVRFLRYEGTTAQVGERFNLIKDITLEKALPLTVGESRILLESQMREFQRLDRDGVFRKIPEYPSFAWMEGIVNAVTHRDYSLQGDYIRVVMYDDRLEISSPGRLPSIVTVDNIQNTRFSRNPLIARVLGDFGYVRELNEGVKRIYTDMESYFLDPPVFSEPNYNTVLLVLKNNIAARSLRRLESQQVQQYWKELEPLDRELVFYIANLDKCTPRVLIETTGKSRPTILQHLKKMVAQGILTEHATSLKDPRKYYTLQAAK